MTIRNALNNYLQNNPQVRQNILKGFDAATKQSGASSPANKANQDNSIFSQKYSPEIQELLNQTDKQLASADKVLAEAREKLGPQKHSTMDIVRGFLQKNPELAQNLNNLSNQFNTVKPEDSPKTSEPAPATQNPNIRPEIQELLDQTDKQLASADQVLAEAREKLGTNDQQAQQVTKQED